MSAALSGGRLQTFVEGLDPRMGGGIPPGSVVLIEGGPGCMKSSLAYSILYNNALKHAKYGMYMTIEQPRKDIEDHMAGMGLDKRKDKQVDDHLVVVDLGELRTFLTQAGESELDADWFRSVLNQIASFRKEHPLELFVLDSLNGLFALHAKENPRLELFHFIKELKSYPMTSILISEVLPGHAWAEGTAGFLSDGIIHLEAKRVEDMVNLQLGVVKMRRTTHDHTFFPFIVRKGVFEVVTK